MAAGTDARRALGGARSGERCTYGQTGRSRPLIEAGNRMAGAEGPPELLLFAVRRSGAPPTLRGSLATLAPGPTPAVSLLLRVCRLLFAAAWRPPLWYSLRRLR